jgi:hypothetical protein
MEQPARMVQQVRKDPQVTTAQPVLTVQQVRQVRMSTH